MDEVKPIVMIGAGPSALTAAIYTTREDIDTALKLGLNFPRGPFQMLESHGPAAIRQRLAQLRDRAPAALKPRYDLAAALAG